MDFMAWLMTFSGYVAYKLTVIASGTWKAKKHKAMAAEARAAWKALKRQVGEQLWLRHVMKPGGHQWARGANVLAGRGKQGTRTQVEHMRR